MRMAAGVFSGLSSIHANHRMTSRAFSAAAGGTRIGMSTYQAIQFIRG